VSKKTPRAGAIEGLVIRFAEDRPRPPRKPFLLTYLGDGVEAVDEIGLFQRGTTAEIGLETAARLRGQPGWRVERRPAVDERPRGEDG